MLLKPTVAEPGEVIELIIKAEPFTNVYLLSVSNLLAFEPKEQEIRKLMVSWNVVRKILNVYYKYLIYNIQHFE